MPTLKFPLISGALALAAALVFLRGAPGAYPIDDAYIHFAYADNLAAGRGLVFQAPGESGLGTTSALWVGLLALGAAASVPPVHSASVLGVLALAVSAGLTAALVEPAAQRRGARWAALAAGALTALCGPLVWFALSGMETMLFAALGLAALLAYRAERWKTLGLMLGLLYITRPEGLALAAAIGAIEAIRLRRTRSARHLLWTAGVAAVFILPWLGYLYWRTGELLPSSYYGKQFTQQVAIDYFAERLGGLETAAGLGPVVFAALSLGYWFMFFWGGAYLPGPRVNLTGPGAPVSAEASVAAFAVGALWILLMARGVLWLWRDRAEIRSPERSAWLAFGLWLVLHNGAFALLLPAPGTASRYIAVDYLALAAALALGLPAVATRAAIARARAAHLGSALATAAVAGVTVFTLAYWRDVYQSSAQQIAEVRIPMAQRINQVAPPQAVVAAFDIGVIAYYARPPVADLGGLTDERFLAYADSHRVDDYLCAVGARYLVAPDSSTQSGGSYYDYLGSLGLRANPEVKLTTVASVSMDVDEWQIGGAATGNSTAAVLLFRVEPSCT